MIIEQLKIIYCEYHQCDNDFVDSTYPIDGKYQ